MPRVHIGPGPAKYKLPPCVGSVQHDYTKYRYPAYSIGIKTKLLSNETSPGPKYKLDHMTKFGKASPPQFSMKSRCHQIAPFNTPGPGAYRVEKVPPMSSKRAPAYSIFSRHQGPRGFVTPASNAYELPTTIGPKVPDKPAKAAYSMSFKPKYIEKFRSPGPAQYGTWPEEVNKLALPRYSISPRIFPPESGPQGPGPIYKPKIPKKDGYSFGLRVDRDPYITVADNIPCISTDDIC